MFTEQDALRLEEFLEDVKESKCSFAAFDGLVTAVISGPEMVPPSEWLDCVIDSDRVWETRDQARNITRLLMGWYNVRASTLFEEPELFEPAFDEIKHGNRLRYDSCLWCAGYMRGVELRAKAWEPLWVDEDGIYLKLISIMASADETERSDFAKTVKPKQQFTAVSHIVPKIYAYWRESGTVSPVRRLHPKISPNAPCPCGSGKKYKRCCGGAS